jgi:uracil-DNA glycosylase
MSTPARSSFSENARDGETPLDFATSLERLAHAAHTCRNCPLYRHATQTVFGEGPAKAKLILVGEQPGDQEDLQGHPFVGPAGHLLDRCLTDAGLDRRQIYVTNAVKHFKWEPAGKRRLHKKPGAREIAACKPWLQAELQLIQPRLVVALGATAAQAFKGPAFRVTKDRGRLLECDGANHFMATVHPSSLLRARPEDRASEIALFVADLRKAADYLKKDS